MGGRAKRHGCGRCIRCQGDTLAEDRRHCALQLHAAIAFERDGVVCVSEPRAAPEAGMFEGRVTLLH